MVRLATIRQTRCSLLSLCFVSVLSIIIGWECALYIQSDNLHGPPAEKTPVRKSNRHASGFSIVKLPDPAFRNVTAFRQLGADPALQVVDPGLPKISVESSPVRINKNKNSIPRFSSSTPSKKDARALWRVDQEKRRHTLRQACKRFGNFSHHRTIAQLLKSTRSQNFWPFAVIEKHRLLYTWISKDDTDWMNAFIEAGRTEKVFGKGSDRLGSIGKARIVKLSSLPVEKIKQCLANYTSVIFVKNPFARILAAYRDKFIRPNEFYSRHIGVKIIKMYRKSPSADALRTGRGVTFPEFVRYITHEKSTQIDYRWKPMYRLIWPCTLRFDYIIKQETGNIDIQNIIQETHLLTPRTHRGLQRSRNVTEPNLDQFYSMLPVADLVRLYKMFKADFKLFGYEVPGSLKGPLKNN